MDLGEITTKVRTYMEALMILEGLLNDKNDMIKDLVDSVRDKVHIITQDVEKIKEMLMKQTESISILNELIATLERLQKRVDYVCCNAPNKDIKEINSKSSMSTNIESSTTNQIDSSSQLPSNLSEIGTPLSSALKPRNKKINITQTITPITETEIDSVPKYMRGRMTAASINKFIDAFNEVVTKKYELVKQPKSMLKKKDLEQYYKWKLDENAQPKGSFFITADDLNQVGNLKMDKLSNNMITVLRHLKRLRETRQGGLVYFTVI